MSASPIQQRGKSLSGLPPPPFLGYGKKAAWVSPLTTHQISKSFPFLLGGARSCAARSLSLTDAQGHCRVQTGLGVRVERGGFWPMEASSSQKRVVMRRRLEGRVVHWQGSMAPTHISLAPLFRLGVEISVVATPLKKGTWALSSLPEGTYSLLGRNSQGEVVSEATIALSPLAGAEVYFSAKR